MNRFIFSGNLTREPELKYSGEGKAYAKFTVAVPRKFNREKSDFFNCTAFGKQAENIAQYCEKGSKVLVEAQVNIDENNGKYCTNVLADSVEFLSTKGKGQGEAGKHPNQAIKPTEDPFANDGTPIDISDEMLPF